MFKVVVAVTPEDVDPGESVVPGETVPFDVWLVVLVLEGVLVCVSSVCLLPFLCCYANKC